MSRKTKTMMTRKGSRNESLDLSKNIEGKLSHLTNVNDFQNIEAKKFVPAMDQLIGANRHFNKLFSMFTSLRVRKQLPVLQQRPDKSKNSEREVKLFQATNQTPNKQAVEEDVMEDGEEYSESEEFNRSEDNILISTKYNIGAKSFPNKMAENKEWVPIGSGKTMIHRDQFKRVNWKSYTIATRRLLLAAFTRKTLATHSLTGKRSPAFLNKPAKMCLDPKIITDIILEIMDRFDVKENLVRSIITTKCADEAKMWKMRLRKQKSKNNENIPPESNDSMSQEESDVE